MEKVANQNFTSTYEGQLSEIISDNILSDGVEIKTENDTHSFEIEDLPVSRQWLKNHAGRKLRILYSVTTEIELLD